jgi:hypothetical protein
VGERNVVVLAEMKVCVVPTHALVALIRQAAKIRELQVVTLILRAPTLA